MKHLESRYKLCSYLVQVLQAMSSALFRFQMQTGQDNGAKEAVQALAFEYSESLEGTQDAPVHAKFRSLPPCNIARSSSS